MCEQQEGPKVISCNYCRPNLCLASHLYRRLWIRELVTPNWILSTQNGLT